MNSLFKSFSITAILLLVLLSVSCNRDTCDKDADRIVMQAARNFHRHYISDYVARTDFYKSVKSGNSYVQLLAMSGIWGSFNFNQDRHGFYFDDANMMGQFLPLDSFGTCIRLPGSTSEITSLSIYSAESGDLELATEYVDDFDKKILVRKRAIEKYGPINPKTVYNYTYKMCENSSSNSDWNKISFCSRRPLSKKNRIVCSGYLYVSTHNNAIKIEIYDISDYYSLRIHSCDTLPSITLSKIEISYQLTDIGYYTSQVVQDVTWDYDKVSGPYYDHEIAPYRNPKKNKLSTHSVICFDEPISGTIAKEISNKGLFPQETESPSFAYVSSVDFDYWKNKLTEFDDIAQIYMDLNLWEEDMGERVNRFQTLVYNQKVASIERNTDIPDVRKQTMIKQITNTVDRSRSLFFSLFRKQYNDYHAT